MKPPAPCWEMEYAHDRREHRHKCRCCGRIVNEGESVIMTRMTAKQTFVIHKACEKKQYGTSEWTWRKAMETWGNDYLRKTGWRV